MCSILVFLQKYKSRKYSFRKLIYVGRLCVFSLLFNLPVVSLYLYHFMASRMFRIDFEEDLYFIHQQKSTSINYIREKHTFIEKFILTGNGMSQIDKNSNRKKKNSQMKTTQKSVAFSFISMTYI